MRLRQLLVISCATFAVSACSTLPPLLAPAPDGNDSDRAIGSQPAPPPRDLKVRWSTTLTTNATRPAVIGTRAFFTDGSIITAVDLASGHVVWSRDFNASGVRFGPPIASQGRVLTAASNAGLGGTYSFDVDGSNSGNLGFHQFVGEIAADGPLTATVNGSYGSGTPVLTTLSFAGNWLLSFGGGLGSGPITITGGRAFMTVNGSVSGFDPNAPCVPVPPPFPFSYCYRTWGKSIAGAQIASNAGRGKVAVASTDGTISVLDGATGTVQFTTANAGTALSATTHSGQGRLFTTGADGLMRVYDSAGCNAAPCAPLWTGTVGSASSVAPTVSNSRVYVATNDGRLVVFATTGCASSTCAPLAVGDSGTGLPATSKPLIVSGVVLATFGNQIYAFKTA